MRLARVAGLLLVPAVVAGCGFLFPFSDEEFAPPSPLATYRTGTATLTLEDGSRIVLDRINAGPHVWSSFGTEVRWFGTDAADGWNFKINGAGMDTPFPSALATFDRVAGGQHWTTLFSDACDLDVEKADKTGIRGTASCEGLRWVDALDGYSMGLNTPSPVEGQPRFDVTVTFEASP
ncbi:MAG TPA: hypothetical protein VH723_07315 [Candidatus Limnocylindrales bacterium]